MFLEILIYFFPLFLYISALHFSLLHLFAKNISKSGAWLIVLPLLVLIHRFAGAQRCRYCTQGDLAGARRCRFYPCGEGAGYAGGQSRRRAEGLARVTGVQRLVNPPALSVTLAFLLQDGGQDARCRQNARWRARRKMPAKCMRWARRKVRQPAKCMRREKREAKRSQDGKQQVRQDAGPTIRCTRAQKRLPHAPGYCIIHLSGRLRRRIVTLSRCRIVRLSQNPITIKRRT